MDLFGSVRGSGLQRLQPGTYFRVQQFSYPTVTRFWIDTLIAVQAIAIEDFEYYAVYESGLLDLAISFMTFKPFELALEVIASLLVTEGRSLIQRTLDVNHSLLP